MAAGQPTLRKVALLIESSRAYGRGLLHGIAAFAQKHGLWSLQHQEMALHADPPKWLEKWTGDGILVRAESKEMVEAIKDLGVPAIDFRCRRSDGKMPGFDTDPRSVVKLAIDHLRDRGHKRFGFCGFGGANYSKDRLDHARRYVSSLGFEFVSYESPQPSDDSTFGAEQSGLLDQEGLIHWLRSLEPPVGILACNDIRAQQILNSCFELNIMVPDEIAVVGVDNDDVICPLCFPPLTSVEPNTFRIGYEAAELLDRMMLGESTGNHIVRIPARQVVVRRSTDSIPVEDIELVKAYRFIRENACLGITVQDVANSVPMSRRALERRVRSHFDKSPAQVISQIRLTRIKELLQSTEHKLSVIARLTGFAHSEHLSKFFKKQTGVAPGRFRTAKQSS